ncbi:hypothetical protein DPMN_058743 [Dreissena polymorpha]|uniref:Uncharacterized protein n=1 Tax=Dreissena polymorpha TaxID=45954 RepID=A0A9D4HE41_DREPO|nr:hypothetical protein DPMN_058743 [Dreissena polymorpha]
MYIHAVHECGSVQCGLNSQCPLSKFYQRCHILRDPLVRPRREVQVMKCARGQTLNMKQIRV